MLSINYFKALSDITRIRVFNVLLTYELSVNEIVLLLNMGQSLISRHLKILNDSGLLSCRRDRVWAFYSANQTNDAKRFIDAISYLFKDDPLLLEDLDKASRLIDDRQNFTKTFFNSIASEWDRLKHDILTDIKLNEIIFNNIKKDCVVADLGCGTGDLLACLSAHISRAIGVDSSVKMLEQAKKRFKNSNTKIDFRLGELEHLPIGNGEVDTVIFSLVLHHLPSPESAIMESARILKSDGKIIIADFGKHENESMRKKYGDRWLGFQDSEIKRWLSDQGFELRSEASFVLKESIRLSVHTAIKK
ncbi:MAG: metalloregulator ArsR/SmtB family transcription factor [Proteobacteria bacterium]|nr:metalloregulator ArsR/SmtB family transcription factor [Pseudomonadota bacterium]